MSILSFPARPGASYFFTVRLADPASSALIDHISLLRDCVALTRKRLPFEISAACVLPAALHMVWTLPKGDDDTVRRWRLIRATFSKHLPDDGRVPKPVWQRRVWGLPIRSPLEMTLYKVHCVTAPVREGLVTYAEDWAYSSLQQSSGQMPLSVLGQPRQTPPQLRLVS